MKKLTYRGMNPQPAEVAYAKFPDFQPGDQILSTYEHEGEFYASWLDPARSGTFIVRAMGDDEAPIKTGLAQGESANFFLVRGGRLTLLGVEKSKSAIMDTYTFTCTDVELEVHDNLYYTLCPEWPGVEEITLASRPAATNLPFFRWLPYNQFQPLFTAGMEFELVTGSGRLTPSRTLNFWRYWFRPDDFERGYIELKVKAIPLANCQSDNLTQIVKIIIP